VILLELNIAKTKKKAVRFLLMIYFTINSYDFLDRKIREKDNSIFPL